jgi:hypothetical protein
VVDVIVPMLPPEEHIELPVSDSAVGLLTAVTFTELLVDVQLVGACAGSYCIITITRGKSVSTINLNLFRLLHLYSGI